MSVRNSLQQAVPHGDLDMTRLPLAAMCVALFASGASADVPDLMGNWAREDGNSRIEITQCGAKVCATNTWIKDVGGSESVGDRLVMTLKPHSASVLNGEAFDQKRDMTFSMRISIDPASRMVTSGCVLIGLLCKTETWIRIQ
jgi:uncharacterized protein (DUF2147 family)